MKKLIRISRGFLFCFFFKVTFQISCLLIILQIKNGIYITMLHELIIQLCCTNEFEKKEKLNQIPAKSLLFGHIKYYASLAPKAITQNKEQE